MFGISPKATTQSPKPEPEINTEKKLTDEKSDEETNQKPDTLTGKSETESGEKPTEQGEKSDESEKK